MDHACDAMNFGLSDSMKQLKGLQTQIKQGLPGNPQLEGPIAAMLARSPLLGGFTLTSPAALRSGLVFPYAGD